VPGSRDIALISLGTTPGLRRADDAFASAAEVAGASCELIRVRIGAAGKLRRQITATDLVEAVAARRAAQAADARVIVYSTVTAALLQRPRLPYAIRFDSPAALNRPGVAGAWQRRAEIRAMRGATALLPWGEAAAAAIPSEAASTRVVPLHVPVDVARTRTSGPADLDPPRIARGADRDSSLGIDALAYAGYPEKRGLDLLMQAWSAVGEGRRLIVAGIGRERAEEWLRGRGIAVPAGVEWRGLLERGEWEATLACARIFVNASRREDHGLSQLEALAAGCMLVTVPSAGPYEALPIARRLDSEFVTGEFAPGALATALGAALRTDGSDYAARAQRELAPYGRDSVQRVFEQEVLPALGIR
jgi:glycosyltransferase involved in cell wall biosynthesis